MAISQNSLVKINYKGTLEDGSVFDSSEGREPLEFIFGVGMIIPGLEKGLEGLSAGEKKTIEVKAADAYGPVLEQAIQQVPKDQFPTDIELKPGLQLAAQGPQGTIPVIIKEVQDDVVVVDFNHPLAGKDLSFEVEVVEEKVATDEDKQRILGPMTDGGCSSGGCAGCSDENCESHAHDESSLEDALDEDSSDEEKKE